MVYLTKVAPQAILDAAGNIRFADVDAAAWEMCFEDRAAIDAEFTAAGAVMSGRRPAIKGDFGLVDGHGCGHVSGL